MRRADDDGGAVLVVVEDRDLHALAQLALDVEALRRLDVFEVDAAERRLERGDDVDQLVRVGLVDLDVEHVDAGELLEQHALAFHHRLRRQRADIAQAQHRGAVGDHADQVAARGVAGGVGRVVDDFFARDATPGEYASARSRWFIRCLVGVTRSCPGAGTRGNRARLRGVAGGVLLFCPMTNPCCDSLPEPGCGARILSDSYFHPARKVLPYLSTR